MVSRAYSSSGTEGEVIPLSRLCTDSILFHCCIFGAIPQRIKFSRFFDVAMIQSPNLIKCYGNGCQILKEQGSYIHHDHSSFRDTITIIQVVLCNTVGCSCRESSWHPYHAMIS
jgi:hypothetical protein